MKIDILSWLLLALQKTIVNASLFIYCNVLLMIVNYKMQINK